MSYRLLTIILFPVFFLYTFKIALRDKSSRYFFQRLGFGYPYQNSKTIWIHCASVGETNTYLPLHLKLLENHPESHFIITTNTTTGARTVDRHNIERTTHCYLPIESSFAIKQFIKTCKPQKCLIMETEIWPLLYQHCYKQNIQIDIINARLSHRTLQANRWIRSIYKKSLNNVSRILCKSEFERNNFISLGAKSEQIEIAGNLKFTCIEKNAENTPNNLVSRPYCVAASTHNNEEQQLAELWGQLNTDKLLVIVPRHPNRSEQIQKQLGELKLNYAVRSQQQSINKNTQVYLADTLGELTDFMTYADFVFMGGSLIKHGGQNLLEPARLGKPVICGPHMFNFTDELELLLNHQACIQVSDINELENLFVKLLDQPDQYRLMGTKAKEVLGQQSDILTEYLKYL